MRVAVRDVLSLDIILTEICLMSMNRQPPVGTPCVSTVNHPPPPPPPPRRSTRSDPVGLTARPFGCVRKTLLTALAALVLGSGLIGEAWAGHCSLPSDAKPEFLDDMPSSVTEAFFATLIFPVNCNTFFGADVAGALVTDLELDDFIVTNGTATYIQYPQFPVQSGKQYYVISFKPSNDGVMKIKVRTQAAKIYEPDGHALNRNLHETWYPGTSQTSFVTAALQPTVIVSSEAVAPVSAPFKVNIDFDRAKYGVFGLSHDEIQVTGGTESTFKGSGLNYSILVTPDESALSLGNAVTVRIPANAARDNGDSVGNQASNLFTIAVDTSEPGLGISGRGSPSGDQIVTVEFTKFVEGFDERDVMVSGGAVRAGSLTERAQGRIYEVAVTPSAAVVEVAVAAGAAADLLGQPSAAASATLDAVMEKIQVSGPQGTVTGEFGVTIASTEAFGDTGAMGETLRLSSAAVTIVNGTLAEAFLTDSSSPGSIAGSSYAGTVIPSGPGVVTVRLATGAVRDRAGNPSAASNVFNVSADTATAEVPTQVQGLKAQAGLFEVVLTWTPNPDEATAYETRHWAAHASQPDDGWVTVPKLGEDLPSHIIIDGLSFFAYAFQVRARNQIGPGEATEKVEATPLSTGTMLKPKAPEDLRAEIVSDTSVTLHWTVDPSISHDYYEYDLDKSDDWQKTQTFGVAINTHPITGLAAGTTVIRFRLGNEHGPGIYGEVNVTLPPLPGALSLLTVSPAVGVGQVRLEWIPPLINGSPDDTNLTGYQYSVDGQATWITVSGAAARYVETTLPTDGAIIYVFWARAVNARGVGPATSASHTWAATAPANLRAVPGNKTITVYWDAPAADAGITHYNYKVTDSDGDTVASGSNLAAPLTSIAISTGLVNGTMYKIEVAANTLNSEANATVTATPTDAAAVVLSRNQLEVAESGGTEQYTVQLNRAPSGAVTVTPSSNAPGTATVSGALTFRVADWEQGQTVTVTGVNDATDGNRTAEITHTVVGGGYGAAPAVKVAVTVIDDDAPLVSLVVTPAVISEEGGVSTVTATLPDRAAGSDVTVTVSARPEEGARLEDFILSLSPTLTIAAGQMESTGTVTVTAVSDPGDLDECPEAGGGRGDSGKHVTGAGAAGSGAGDQGRVSRGHHGDVCGGGGDRCDDGHVFLGA